MKFFHIGFYVAKIDPGIFSSNPAVDLVIITFFFFPSLAYGGRRQLQLSKDQLIIKAGFDAKKESI